MKMPSTTASPVSVRLSETNRANMDRFAKLTRRSRSFIINEAMETYLRDRIAYLEEIEEALEEVHSGYGHSSGQIHAWMQSWGTENELPTPSPDIVPHK
jgi:predicted transcriptional regulator